MIVKSLDSDLTCYELISDLKLAYPKMIDVAVPANMVCGLQDPAPTAL